MLDKKTIKFIGLGFLFLLVIIISIRDYYKEVALDNEHRYTVGYVYSIKARGSGGINVYYNFKVNDKEVTNMEVDTYFGNKLLNKHFLVKYQPSNPKNCKIMLYYWIEEGLKAPPEGWNSIPIKK